MKIVTRLLAVIVLIVVAYYVYTNAVSVPAANAPSSPTVETPAVDADSAVRTSASLIGTWRSIDDAKFMREFRSDGTVTDTYEGDASATTVGEWTLFTSANADAGFPGTIASGVMYLKMTTQYEAMFFTVLKVDANELQLSYLDRGNTLNFTRVK